ncbi:MAG: phage integrase N-terminal SAM-like domain-containing protein, partial [Acidobacteriota bacterium]
MDPKTPTQPPRLLDEVRAQLRVLHRSRRTEKSYVGWIRRYIRFHGTRHPKDMAEKEVSAFLTHLADQRKVSASTQRQALCALIFLYKEVLKIDHGQSSAAAGLARVDFSELDLEDFLVEEDQRAERLALGGSADFSLVGEVGQEGRD